MKRISLGRSGLTVSEMCMGAMNFGTYVDEASSAQLLDAFLDAGGNFIDTSNNYAHWAPGAVGDESEKLLGRWLAQSGKRNEVVLATKVGFDRHGVGAGLRAAQIERWCDESLRNLKTDVIDLYYAHVDDMNTPVEETMEAFDRLLRKGKVRAIGASNYYTWRLCEVREACEKYGFADYTVLQQRYSYLFMENGLKSPYPYNEAASTEKLRYLAKYGLPLVAYSCNAGGGYADEARLPKGFVKGERLEALQNMAAEKGVPANVLQLAWMLHSWRFADRPQIVPLFSAGSLAHLEENLSAAEVQLTTEEAAFLNEA